MNNVLIGCNCNSSFSIPKISTESLCSSTFSGLSCEAISNSPECWTKFSGLGIPAMNKVLIGCNCNSSFSMPNISTESLCSNIFSGLSLVSNTISPVCCTKFSGLGVFSMTNSPDLCSSFSGFLIPAMNNWFIGWITVSSFSIPKISTESLCSNIFSGLGSFSITISPDLWTSFSGLSRASTTNALINCVTIGAFSIATISILSLCSLIFSGLSCFFNSIDSLMYSRFSHGNFCPWTKM